MPDKYSFFLFVEKFNYLSNTTKMESPIFFVLPVQAPKKLGQVEHFRAPTPPTPPTPLPDVSTPALLSQVCRANLSQVLFKDHGLNEVSDGACV